MVHFRYESSSSPVTVVEDVVTILNFTLIKTGSEDVMETEDVVDAEKNVTNVWETSPHADDSVKMHIHPGDFPVSTDGEHGGNTSTTENQNEGDLEHGDDTSREQNVEDMKPVDENKEVDTGKSDNIDAENEQTAASPNKR